MSSRLNQVLFALTLLFVFKTALADDVQDLVQKSEISTALIMKDAGLDQDAGVRAVHLDVTREGKTEWVKVELSHSRLGAIRLLMKGPAGFLTDTSHSLRSVLLVSGFFTGQEGVRFMGDVPGTVVIGFQYPFGTDDFQRDPSKIFEFIRRTPGQIALALEWISAQTWLKPHGSIAMGVSLGGLFLPSSLHVAQKLGVETPRAIFVCSGAHITPVLEQDLRETLPDFLLKPLVQGVANLTALHDPKIHLPLLAGNFLVIRADADQVFPLESSLMLENLLVGPTKVLVHGPHINEGETEVIRQTREAVLAWVMRTE